MRTERRISLAGIAIALVAAVLAPRPARAQVGLAVGGVGPVNRAMGGAAVAAPLDPAGALFWNPASITGLGRSEMMFGTELLIPRTTLASKIGAGTFGPGVPASPLSGRSSGNNGVFPLPVFALVYQPEATNWTYGIGLFELGGFGVNYAASKTNPVLMPQTPFGRGVGALFTQYQVLQIAPTAAYRLTDALSAGFSADLDMGGLSVNPALFAAPALVSSPLGPGPYYPPATNGRFRFGGGFQAGLFYTPQSDWMFGAAIKGPQWFDTYKYNAVSGTGQPTTPRFHLNFPMILSVGTAYTGFDRWLFAGDLRYVDYRNTAGFQRTGFDKQGALRGLGWQSIFTLALGAQYQWTDAIALRAGYSFNMNPEGNAVASYNIASPTILQNTISLGASYDVTRALQVSLAYVHMFENSIHGPIVEPSVGPVRGSEVKSTATADSVIVGASVIF